MFYLCVSLAVLCITAYSIYELALKYSSGFDDLKKAARALRLAQQNYMAIRSSGSDENKDQLGRVVALRSKELDEVLRRVS